MQNNIWKEIQNSNPEAMKTLYNECYQDLYGYAFRILPERDSIKDCLHEIFCEIWAKRNIIGEIENIKAYLKICVRNRILKEIRQNTKIESLKNIDESLGEMVYSYEQLLIESQLIEERKLKIWKAINLLTPMQRKIISLKFYDNLNYQQIGLQLKLKPRTVYNHIHTAISNLKTLLKK